jgi:xanthine dehydrogenase accessory factor
MFEDLYKTISELQTQGLRAALATVIGYKGSTPRKDSAKMLIYEDGRQIGSIGGGSIEEEVCQKVLNIIENGKPRLMTFDLTGIDHDERALICGGSMQIYLEAILPDPVLYIFGAGHVSKAVAAAASLIGFKIVVMDDRSKFATQERFPNAEVRIVEIWEIALRDLNVRPSSYFFIATQKPRIDQSCLCFAAKSDAKYIGMLGSLKKTQILFDAAQKAGIDLSSLKKVCVPAGFDIDSETPEEIAASIAAELVAARKNLNIQNLRESLRRINNEDLSGA